MISQVLITARVIGTIFLSDWAVEHPSSALTKPFATCICMSGGIWSHLDPFGYFVNRKSFYKALPEACEGLQEATQAFYKADPHLVSGLSFQQNTRRRSNRGCNADGYQNARWRFMFRDMFILIRPCERLEPGGD